MKHLSSAIGGKYATFLEEHVSVPGAAGADALVSAMAGIILNRCVPEVSVEELLGRCERFAYKSFDHPLLTVGQRGGDLSTCEGERKTRV